VRAIRELIAEALGRGRNAMAIWQDLVDDHGFTGQYASVRRFVVKLRGAAAPEARVVITTAPGEEGQVDYGDGPMVRYPQTGKYRRTRLFVLTLGYSRKAVRLLVWHSSTQVWAELHERAFRRLGGCDPQKFLPTHKVSEFRAIGLRKAICGRSGA
jgi:transposase